jgi:hypothetical protein
MTSDDTNKSIRPSPASPASADAVPTILLEPIAPTITLHASTDSEDEDDDMDLLAIVKRKHNRRSAIL